MLYQFQLGHNTMKTTKNICSMKGKDTVDHSNHMVCEILLGS